MWGSLMDLYLFTDLVLRIFIGILVTLNSVVRCFICIISWICMVRVFFLFLIWFIVVSILILMFRFYWIGQEYMELLVFGDRNISCCMVFSFRYLVFLDAVFNEEIIDRRQEFRFVVGQNNFGGIRRRLRRGLFGFVFLQIIILFFLNFEIEIDIF